MRVDPSSETAQRSFRSTVLLGSASAVNALSQMIRAKAIAVLLGTSGIALQGLFISFVSLSATVGGLGIAGGAVREISALRGREHDFAPQVRVLRDACGLLAALLIGVAVFAGDVVARAVFDGEVTHREVVVLAASAGLTIVLSGQTALLRATGKVTQVARLSASVSLGATGVAVAVVWLGGRDALVFTVALVVLVQVIVATWFVRRVGLPTITVPLRQWLTVVGTFLAVGVPIVGAVLVVSATDFLGRFWILERSGLEEAGYFQVSRSLSIGLISVLLSTLWSDYFPRLSSLAGDSAKSREMVLAQTSQLLALLAPLMVVLVGFADLAVWLLYSAELSPAIPQLRVQVIGDVLKVAAWPLAVYALALRASRFFFFSQVVWAVVFLGVLRGLVDVWGAMAANVAHLVSYSVYFVLLAAWARYRTGGAAVPWMDVAVACISVSFVCFLASVSLLIARVASVAICLGLLFRLYRMVVEVEGVRSIRHFPTAVSRLLRGRNL